MGTPALYPLMNSKATIRINYFCCIPVLVQYSTKSQNTSNMTTLYLLAWQHCTYCMTTLYLLHDNTVPTAWQHCTYTVPTAWQHCTYTVPTAWQHCTYTVPTAWQHCTYTVPTAWQHCTYTVPAAWQHCTYTVPTAWQHCTYCMTTLYLLVSVCCVGIYQWSWGDWCLFDYGSYWSSRWSSLAIGSNILIFSDFFRTFWDILLYCWQGDEGTKFWG